MWKVEIVRVYKSSNLLYEHEDKVIFEVNSLKEASEITSMFDKYAVGEYKYSMPDFPADDVINAVAVGMASGLAATGVNQLYKQQCK